MSKYSKSALYFVAACLGIIYTKVHQNQNQLDSQTYDR